MGLHSGTLAVAVGRVTVVPGSRGFTLLELLIVLSIIAVLGAIVTLPLTSYYGGCCVKAVMWDLAGMVREAKQCALEDKYYGICFDAARQTITLVSGRGPDGAWNTADDPVVRIIQLEKRGGALGFGYGSYGPVPTYAVAPDGIAIPGKTFIFNPDLTGNAGTVYIRSRFGAAMALTMNSTAFGYKLRIWNNSGWSLL
jgi:prepilin-type N-terminal cleavage/methylation domain-containing protein